MQNITVEQLYQDEREIVIAFLEGKIDYIRGEYYPDSKPVTFRAYAEDTYSDYGRTTPPITQEILDSLNQKGVLHRKTQGIGETGLTQQTVYVSVVYRMNERWTRNLLRSLWSTTKPQPVPYETLLKELDNAANDLAADATWFPESRRNFGPTRGMRERTANKIKRLVAQARGETEEPISV